MKKNNITIISLIIVLLVLCLSIGWASLNSSMHVESMAMVRIKSDIRVTGFNSVTSSNNGTSINEEYNVNYITGTISLPSNNSTVTYQVEITNMEIAANTFMGISGLTGLPNNLKIVNVSNYTLRDKICDDNNGSDCSSGAQKTFNITIGYNNDSYDANNTTFDFKIDFEFKKVFDIHYSGFTNPPAIVTVMDGDTPTINFNSDASNSLIITSGGQTLILGTNYTYTNHVLTFITPIDDHVFINNPVTYTITYELNGGVQANNQITTYSINRNQEILNPTKQGNIFGGWYLESDFSGNDIRNTSQLNGNVILYANWVTQKARIGSTYYDTLQLAIDDVTTNNVETTVELLDDTSEIITVAQNKNIVLDLKNNVLSNSGVNPVITNNGVIAIINGKITSNTSQGAINNNATGVINMSGGSIETKGNKQAIYNSGLVNIYGNANLNSTSKERPVITNLTGGTTNITSGTIISTGFSAIVNEGTLRIGTKDGNVSTSIPLIRGATYGISATTSFNFYDGRISGKTQAINNEHLVNDIETNFELLHQVETISGASYRTVYLSSSFYTVTFVAGDGTVNESTRDVEPGQAIGTLPIPTRAGYVFLGWFDDDNNGDEITSTKIINEDYRFYAHWILESEYYVARIGNTDYLSFDAALSDIPNNEETTITILRNMTTNLTIPAKKKIILDLTGITLTNDTAYSVITNNGTLTILNGNIQTNSLTAAAVNNEKGGVLTINGTTIVATGERQAVYNDKSTITITGNCHFTASATARGTVQNQGSSTMIITGGTIVSLNQQAVSNAGTLTIGSKDSNISTTNPDLLGATYGVTNTNSFKYYDGVLKGKIDSISGSVSEIETNATRVDTTEIIDGQTYHKTYLN